MRYRGLLGGRRTCRLGGLGFPIVCASKSVSYEIRTGDLKLCKATGRSKDGAQEALKGGVGSSDRDMHSPMDKHTQMIPLPSLPWDNLIILRHRSFYMKVSVSDCCLVP